MTDKLDEYIDLLVEAGRSMNLVSRDTDRRQLGRLVSESRLLGKFIKSRMIVDAGSGNGLLGIPLAVMNHESAVVLVETNQKKCRFLETALRFLALGNATLYQGPIKQWVRSHRVEAAQSCVVARGFPRLDVLLNELKKGRVAELAVITSPDKTNKMEKDMERVVKNRYNIPSRDHLVVIKMEYVSRETF